MFFVKNEKRAVFLREKLSENRPEIAFTSPIPRSRSKSAFGIFLFLLKIEFWKSEENGEKRRKPEKISGFSTGIF